LLFYIFASTNGMAAYGLLNMLELLAVLKRFNSILVLEEK
jgi:hypothetical protein